MAYTSPVVGGRCLQCISVNVAQEHRYTPDLFISTKPGLAGKDNESSGYYLEAKGNLLQSKRGLLRHFRKARPDVDLRFVLQRKGRAGKGSLVDWVTKYLKVPVTVWPELPTNTLDSYATAKPPKAGRPGEKLELHTDSASKVLQESATAPIRKTRIREGSGSI